MVFAKRSKEEVSLFIDGVKIERVLGIILDENLTWKSHVSYVKKKTVKEYFHFEQSQVYFRLQNNENVVFFTYTALLELLCRCMG